MQENPFVHELKLTKWQKIQIAIMSFTIFPIRLILAFCGFAIVWFLALIFTIGAKQDEQAGPYRNSLYNILQFLGRVLAFILGFRSCKCIGKRATFQEAPILIVTPHSSIWDILVFFISSPFPCALSKFENFRIPIFGTLMKAVQPILVHRNNELSKQVTADAIKKRVASGLWPQLVVFPEGTCTNRKCLIKFKLGAFLAGTPVQPVILKYICPVDIATWTEISPSAFYLIWLTMCQINLHLTVEYLPVYKPSQKEIDNPKLYASNVQEYLAKKLHMPISDHTYEDRLLMRHAGKLKLPKHIAVLQFYKVSKQLKITLNDAMDRLNEFANICTEKTGGYFTSEDLSRFLQLPVTPLLRQLFVRLGSEKQKKISYYQYVMGYYSVLHEINEGCKLISNINLFMENFRIAKQDHAEINQIFNTNDIEVNRMSTSEIIEFMTKKPLYGILILWKIISSKHCSKTGVSNLHKRK